MSVKPWASLFVGDSSTPGSLCHELPLQSNSSSVRKVMSNKRLSDNVRKYAFERKPDSLGTWTPVILTDSKGRYLRKVLKKGDQTEKRIRWLGRSGFNSNNAVDFLKTEKIKSLLKFHNQISLYIWVGTCDLTAKFKRFIDLRTPSTRTLDTVCRNLQIIANRCRHRHLKVTFLHCPYYSIQHWNKNKGHKNPDIYAESDKRLTHLVDSVNSFIDRLNRDNHTYSPKLNMDLQRGRKRRGGKQRQSLNFKLFLDGIHPDKKLAKSWLTSIKRKINQDCGHM